MAHNTQLRDLYAFPGFTPATYVRGLFGDPYAVVIPLRRRSKKLYVESAARFIASSTIKRSVRSAILMPADDASIFRSPFAASPVESVTP
jgi:hypothetical protein